MHTQATDIHSGDVFNDVSTIDNPYDIIPDSLIGASLRSRITIDGEYGTPVQHISADNQEVLSRPEQPTLRKPRFR